jgi:hypothetical protein
MSERQDKRNIARTISTREYDNVAPFTRTLGKGTHRREVSAAYPNRAQRRGNASGQLLSPVAPGAHGHHR